MKWFSDSLLSMPVHEVKMVLFPLPAIFIVHLGGRKLDGFLERCLQRSHYGSQHDHELCIYFDLHAYPLSQRRLLIQSFFFLQLQCIRV